MNLAHQYPWAAAPTVGSLHAVGRKKSPIQHPDTTSQRGPFRVPLLPIDRPSDLRDSLLEWPREIALHTKYQSVLRSNGIRAREREPRSGHCTQRSRQTRSCKWPEDDGSTDDHSNYNRGGGRMRYPKLLLDPPLHLADSLDYCNHGPSRPCVLS